MSEVSQIVPLPARGLLRLTGPDRVTFLDNLVSNDITTLAADGAVYATLLTPQGMFLHDFLVVANGEALVLDCERERAEDLKTRLLRYRLRSKVDISDESAERDVAALLNATDGATPNAGADTLVYRDPRHPDLGHRVIFPAGTINDVAARLGASVTDFDLYETRRLSHGVPDGSRDMAVGKALLLEHGIDRLNGIDWDKGCYMGQELTARTRYRANIRKRLMTIRADAPLPPSGTPVMAGDQTAGEMKSSTNGIGLALLRLDSLPDPSSDDAPLTADGMRLEVFDHGSTG